MELDALKKYQKVIIELRDSILSKIAASPDQRGTDKDKMQAEALSLMIRLADAEIGTVKAILSRVEAIRSEGKH